MESSQELRDAQTRLSRTKYIALVAFLGLFISLFYHVQLALIIFAGLMILWGVCTYIAFMHLWTIKNRHKERS